MRNAFVSASPALRAAQQVTFGFTGRSSGLVDAYVAELVRSLTGSTDPVD